MLKLTKKEINDYIEDLLFHKEENKMTWEQIADAVYDISGIRATGNKYKKQFYRLKKRRALSEVDIEEKKEDYKASDVLTQANAIYRRIAREETIKEIARDCAKSISERIPFQKHLPIEITSEKEAILQISDWHYGIDIDNYWNKYNPSIAKERVMSLLSQVRKYCEINNVNVINIVNLSDLIAGRIHLTIRLNSRIDAITQIIEVSELLAQFIDLLSDEYIINYYDALDNHSRLEPNINNSLDLESLTRITFWYLKERFLYNENVNIYENTFSDDIISFDCLGHKIIAVHGDKDKPENVIENMTMMTHQHYDLVLTAHLHHFSANEQNETLMISNGSLMGTDDYAQKLRLSAKPSQNLIFVTKDNVCESLYRLVLE